MAFMLLGLFSAIFWALSTSLLFGLSIHAFFAAAAVDIFSLLLLLRFSSLSLSYVLKNWPMLLVSLASITGLCSFIASISMIGPGLAATLSSLYPIFAGLLAFLILRQRLSKMGLVALVVAICSSIFLGLINIEYFTINILGIALGLLCALCWGTECVLVNLALKSAAKPIELLALRQAISSAFHLFLLLPSCFFLFKIPLDLSLKDCLLIALAAAFFCASYLCYYKAIEKIGALKAMGLNMSYAAFALIFSLILGQELLPGLLAVAFVIIICGILSNF